MQDLLASSCSHRFAVALGSQQHQSCHVSEKLALHTLPYSSNEETRACMVQCTAQPSFGRRQGAFSTTQTPSTQQSLQIAASKAKRLQIAHAVQRPGTKQTDHRWTLCMQPYRHATMFAVLDYRSHSLLADPVACWIDCFGAMAVLVKHC